ncbi:MAG: hypothetical protein RRA15_08465 [bacterium]|nr:hypothetical protein [bacterium]MDT8366513.1 hypothetical protein [bacterium]
MRSTFTAIAMIFILTIPALSQGSIGPGPCLELPELETGRWDAYHLEIGAGTFSVESLDHGAAAGKRKMNRHSLNEIHGGLSYSGKPAPGDMASMMSFVWAEIFGGVDIVAEVKDFARQMKGRGRFVNVSRIERRDSRSKWSFIVACRVDKQTEVAARFKNRGWFLRESKMALEINTLDPVSEEVGLNMAYIDGDINIRADRMTLT